MKYQTPEISWHEREPVFSVDIQPSPNHNSFRLASAGADKTIRIWTISSKGFNIECTSTLTRHIKTVNVVRFSPTDKILASGGDDSFIILWELDSTVMEGLCSEGDREGWKVVKILRGHMEDVHDICWSQDGTKLLSGSIDNTAVLWDVKKGLKLFTLTDHKGFVQGVAFDPLSHYITTLSSDRSMRVFQASTGNLSHGVRKVVLAGKAVKLFHDDSMKSFFRRLSFSPDGCLLVVPSASFEDPSICHDEAPPTFVNSSLVFSRDNLSKPLLYLPLPTGCRNSVAVRFCPVLFALRKIRFPDSMIQLPYRMIFVVATDNSLVLYDTQQTCPILCLTNIHYHTLNDVTWSSDGLMLVASSSDGYCTMVKFEEGELGMRNV